MVASCKGFAWLSYNRCLFAVNEEARPKIAIRKPDGSCLGSPPAPVAVDLVDFHVKESGASNAPGGGGPPNRATHRASALYSDLDE
jgi:hypothetical protein